MNKLEINNKIIIKTNFKNLLLYNINIPNIQRILDIDKVNNIVAYQINYYKNNNNFNILGVINIHFNKENNMYYLIDGQHRYNALHKLNELGHTPDFFIEIVYINNYKELQDNYNLINTNTPLPELPNNVNKDIIETVAIYFKNKYNEIWSKNSRTNRPHIYFDYFLEAVGVLYSELKDLEIIYDNSEDLVNIIEEYNSKLKYWPKNSFPEYSSITDNMYNKCIKWKFYLGLFKHISDKYRYKWVKNIIYEKTGKVITNPQNKKKIPKKLKIDVWNKYIGTNERNTICICCNNTKLDISDFHAGHIISEKNGGLTNIDNIIPICNLCNNSMNSMNIDIYIKTYYSQNYNNYIKFINKSNNDNSELYNYWIF